MRNRWSGHGVYRTEYHIVWITKYRRRILNSGVKGYLDKLFPKVLRGMPGCEVVQYNIQIDHIHVVIVIPPKYAVSEVIGKIKCWTAKELRKKFGWLEKVYWEENIVWSPGYFVATVGLDEQEIIAYIKWQSRQDSGQVELDF